MVLTFVLGWLMEQSFRQAMTISDGSFLIFVGSPITVILFVVSLISIALPFVLSRFACRKATVDRVEVTNRCVHPHRHTASPPSRKGPQHPSRPRKCHHPPSRTALLSTPH